MKASSILALASSLVVKRKFKLLLAGAQFAYLAYVFWKNRQENQGNQNTPLLSLPNRLLKYGKTQIGKKSSLLYDK